MDIILDDIEGLSLEEVEARRQSSGYNELPDREHKNFVKIIFETAREPMILILLAIVVVYFVLGDRTEALVLMVSVLVIICIELYQNNKTEKALEALRGFSSPMCIVIRGGERISVPSRELVVGDIVVVSEGERVPADAKLIHAESLMLDESILTGESISVDKVAGSDDQKQTTIYSGTMVVKGHGTAEVTAIGLYTQMGQIGSMLNDIKPERTLLQKEVDRAIRVIAIFAIATAAILMLAYWLIHGDLLRGFLAGLTLSIAILPEEFPVVLTVFMALGAWRMARKNVLTRKSQAIETLGSASVLCTDKTGTLTQNIMHVQTVTDQTGLPIGPDHAKYSEVVRYGVLASQRNPFDPMEEAFLAAARQSGDVESIYGNSQIVEEYPLDPTSLSVAHVWAEEDSHQQTHVALKGAPEAVFKLCGMTNEQSSQLQRQVADLASDGLRVLAVARGETRQDIPKTRQEFRYEFLGLVALADPIRPEAADAVALCKQAGIRVVMITGDYAETARRIGQEIGLDSDRVVTGEEFSAMSEAEQIEAIRSVSIFSRVVPAQKLSIVNALKNSGEVVAMTGDGVNDAPALKAAHIGVAMGKRGTDVAREAAAIVLLDDNFASIVQGVRLGRRIFGNLQKAMAYILTVHMPIITMSLLPVFMGWPLVLLPIHIVFIEFIIDPSCTLIFEGEPEEPNTMKQPPRKLGSPLFGRRLLFMSAATGGIVSAAIFATHWLLISDGWSDDKARAISFLMIVATNTMLILAISGSRVVRQAFSGGKLNALPAIVAIVSVVMIAIYTIPQLRGFFHIAPISWLEASSALVLSAGIVWLVAPLRKLVAYAHSKNQKAG